MGFYCAFDYKANDTWTLLMQRNHTDSFGAITADIEKHYELAGITLGILKKFIQTIEKSLTLKKKQKDFEIHTTDNNELIICISKLKFNAFKLKITVDGENYEDTLNVDEMKVLFYSAPFVNYLL